VTPDGPSARRCDGCVQQRRNEGDYSTRRSAVGFAQRLSAHQPRSPEARLTEEQRGAFIILGMQMHRMRPRGMMVHATSDVGKDVRGGFACLIGNLFQGHRFRHFIEATKVLCVGERNCMS
jgi:hypothetical protein